MKRLIFVGRGKNEDQKIDGGEFGARRVLKMIQNCVGSDNIKMVCIDKPNVFRRFINMISLCSYGHTSRIEKILRSIRTEEYEVAFFNGSIYGKYVKILSNKGIKVITFYHNIESNFYYDKYKSTKRLIDYLMFMYIKYNESICTKYSDYIITLNDRDSKELEIIYDKKANICLPTSYSDVEKKDIIKKDEVPQKDYILFVGGNFFANVDGITDFIVNALPYIDIDLWVVGSCCDQLIINKTIRENPRVILKGFIENISEVYINASAVICPIYSGSGMKTKTVEALKYGKYIFATPEAFEGIEGDYEQIGGLCKDNNEFINKISKWRTTGENRFNEYSFELFKTTYSDGVVFDKFCKFYNAVVRNQKANI